MKGQSFFKKYDRNGDFGEGSRIIETENTQYIICGSYSESFNHNLKDILYLKTDSLGNILQLKHFGSVFIDQGFDLNQTNDGGYILAGKIGEPDTTGEGLSNVYILKLNNQGDSIWSFKFDGGGGDIANSSGELPDSSIFITGVLDQGINTGVPKSFLGLLTQNGKLKWLKTYDTLASFYSGLYSKNKFYLCGGFQSNFYLIKTDKNGNVILKKNKNWGVANGYAYDLKITSHNNIVITGESIYYTGYKPYKRNLYISKIDSNGKLLWYKTFGEDEPTDFGKAILQCKDGGFVITGMTNSYSKYGGSDIWLIKTDKNGDTLWTKEYGTSEDDIGNDVIQTPDGGYAITGSIYDNRYAFLLKTDSMGNAPNIKLGIDKPNKNNPSIYIDPNPFRQGFNFSFTNDQLQEVTLTIYDLSGRELKRIPISSGNNRMFVDMAGFHSGMYLLKINTADGIYVKQILKQE